MKIETELKLTPEQVAKAIWAMFDDEQAEMFEYLMIEAGSEHDLMMQFMSCRDKCEERGHNSLAAFHAVGSSAYKYILGGC